MARDQVQSVSMVLFQTEQLRVQCSVSLFDRETNQLNYFSVYQGSTGKYVTINPKASLRIRYYPQIGSVEYVVNHKEGGFNRQSQIYVAPNYLYGLNRAIKIFWERFNRPFTHWRWWIAQDRARWELQELGTDEFCVPTRGSDWYDGAVYQKFHHHEYTEDMTSIANGWTNFSMGIALSWDALEDLQKAMDPARYVGRAPKQVEEFLNEVIRPVLAAHPEAAGQHAELNV